MKTFACLICLALVGLVGLPWTQRAMEEFQGDLHRNLACTAATYAALDYDATEAEFDRAEAICAAGSETYDAEGRPCGRPSDVLRRCASG